MYASRFAHSSGDKATVGFAIKISMTFEAFRSTLLPNNFQEFLDLYRLGPILPIIFFDT